MKELEKILKALANRRRLAISKHLKEKGEAPVGEIANKLKLSLKATSKHLGILSAIDIVEREQRSSQAFYKITADQKPTVKHVLSIL